MSLEEKINQDIKAAMMAKEKVKLEALRAIKSAILLAKTDGEHKDSLSTDVEMKILQKQYKQRKDAAEQYIQAGRQELADKELAEAAFIEEYLPKMLSAVELKVELVKIIEQVGAKAPSDMGKVMGVASKALAGKADGKAISEMVKQILAGA
ncbi:MAG TPA: GatB/YqeY domain-containing protein [Tenuifilaceae bacterium]|nr:GatB/YqeY domain-containing protein [Tenuifilaceae bacterium]HOZ14347.1 GatB/YqeY domain-containing protein [Tenuifilaceae bacterium]HPI46099.1 GatB/YqeY domain-containing protein [Tenuifilaceae bacterium]HPN20358.1 GatB/YqeY domain-containing protein [Tenuifilaceae bacterium]HPV55591.1 GatB/YqeY domain-containing protein [Tenuifilaceae bacterium]